MLEADKGCGVRHAGTHTASRRGQRHHGHGLRGRGMSRVRGCPPLPPPRRSQIPETACNRTTKRGNGGHRRGRAGTQSQRRVSGKAQEKGGAVTETHAAPSAAPATRRLRNERRARGGRSRQGGGGRGGHTGTRAATQTQAPPTKRFCVSRNKVRVPVACSHKRAHVCPCECVAVSVDAP